MPKLSSSPERYSKSHRRAIESDQNTDYEYKERMSVDEIDEMYLTIREQTLLKEQDPEWQRDNMEYDLRTSEALCAKVRSSDVYAQNLYAAMCNREFERIPQEDTPEALVRILRDGLPRWSCSWRHAGGIVANMLEKGDYIDWYCSGIRDGTELQNSSVPEGVVTPEVEQDLLSIGWRTLPDDINP